MKKNVCGAGKKVLASALSAAMVVAFAPAVGSAVGSDDAVAYASENQENIDAVHVSTAAELSSAISQAQAGVERVICIDKDINDITSRIDVDGGKVITVDLNGHSITHHGNYVFYVQNAAFNVTGKGSITEDVVDGYAPICIKGSATPVDGYTTVNVDKDVTLLGDYCGIFVTPYASSGSPHAYGVKVTMKGTIDLGQINGQDDPEKYVNPYGSGIYVNGQIADVDQYAPRIVLEGAKIVGAGTGIYAAGYGDWTVNDSTIVGGDSAIELRAGKMTINGGTYTATKTPTKVTPNGNGTTTSGAAVGVVQHTTKAPTELVVNDGTFNGYHALWQSNAQNGDQSAVSKVKISIKGGKYYSTDESGKAIYSENCANFVEKGTFSDLSEIPYAIAGADLKLGANVKDFGGVQISKNLTIDFGDYVVFGAKGARVLDVCNAKVTLKGDKGGINGGAGGNNVAILANSGSEVTIDSGIYTVGGDANGAGNSTVYVKGTGKAVINGGTFSSEKPYNNKYYVLNLLNDATGSITVNRGIIEKQNPAAGDDYKGGNFVGAGSVSHHVGDSYVVHAADAGTTWVGGSSATCTVNGFTSTGYCKGCYDLGISNVTSAGSTIPAFGHDYTWVTTTPATEDAEGVMTGTCSRGDSTITKAIPKLPKKGSDETATDGAGAKVDVTVVDNKAGKTESGTEYVGSVEYNGAKDSTPAAETKVPETVTVNGSTYVVTKIADEAFEGQEQITKVTIPETVVEIGNKAFANTSIESIVIPAATTTLGAGVFQGCDDLKSVDISKTAITEIPADAFNGTSIGSIEIPVTVTSVGERAFKGTALTVIELPKAVKEIAKSTFENCASLKSVTTSATVVGYKALAGCTALKGIDLSMATELGKYALKGDSKLKTVTTGAKLKAIGYKALSGTKVKTLTISSKKLTSASVKGSLKGSSVKKVEVAVSGSKKTVNKYVAKYKKVFKKSNSGKSVNVVAKKIK